MYYKLTNQNMQTYKGFQWELGKWYHINKEAINERRGLCTSAWFHCYDDPYLAVILNTMHTDIGNPRLFKASTLLPASATDHGLKFGFQAMRLDEEMPLPVITAEQRVSIVLLCAKAARFCPAPEWLSWVNDWISGKDRSRYVSDRIPIDRPLVPDDSESIAIEMVRHYSFHSSQQNWNFRHDVAVKLCHLVRRNEIDLKAAVEQIFGREEPKRCN